MKFKLAKGTRKTPSPLGGGPGRGCFRGVALVAALLVTATSSSEAESQVGTRIDDFTLQDYLGAHHSLSEWQDKNAVVVVFVGTECPLAKRVWTAAGRIGRPV